MTHVSDSIRSLCGDFVSRAISPGDFADRFMKLWALYRDTPEALDTANHWIDQLMTTVDSYDHPDERIRLNEDALRAEVQSALHERHL